MGLMSLEQQYPALSDLKARARRRIPHFVWEYLDSATGAETVTSRNRTAFDQVLLQPSILHGEIAPDLSTRFLGRDYPAPFGIAPLGMSGLIWPGAERILARHGAAAGVPYCLSTVATQTPDDLADVIGNQGWFQMYPPRDPAIRTDMLRRAKDAGFHTLVLTVDVPAPSRRERQTRGGLVQPPRLTPRLALQVARCPAWAGQILRSGMPRMRLMDSYAPKNTGTLPSTAHVGYLLRTSPDWAYLAELRAAWDGPLIVKGVLQAEDAARLGGEGVDAIWVSNHAGRQFDAAPATIDALPAIRAATALPILFDSGVEGGLDILRALALGADFVMMGRPWHYALGALGADGPTHLHDLLVKDMIANMAQIGAARLADLPERLVPRQ
ncbi:alpha-hydroxy-acid oxidizing protein [Roseobacter sp. HKCCD9010]|nr:alpha-hydroxy-acid oxidizing protein [Rhodobacterales bacterium HKCCD4356]NNV11505.1 alpha-hydroxy-acid oxidizing protein [Roseobacter sp. HKCCD7357]NNV15689.1 alpha-hydroxy-acid oxidizing protein [Roseobacter sp. HKCCD8768]NNV25149.1 alpha-hydroxy-acid oxidizing protein [Roseobacter sp. HKCCD8192]NNV29406.1 alpha-hydroxy-acid oxidizing protein [Roseobacter sp. HKCCD9061]NNV33679.1 alpha-hydroxy-acid oxidizing protein [Roseobacter sp. HKCCD9073]NNV37929.1 alpha-hydroxy-acid oxidizing prote